MYTVHTTYVNMHLAVTMNNSSEQNERQMYKHSICTLQTIGLAAVYVHRNACFLITQSVHELWSQEIVLKTNLILCNGIYKCVEDR